MKCNAKSNVKIRRKSERDGKGIIKNDPTTGTHNENQVKLRSVYLGGMSICSVFLPRKFNV